MNIAGYRTYDGRFISINIETSTGTLCVVDDIGGISYIPFIVVSDEFLEVILEHMKTDDYVTIEIGLNGHITSIRN